MNSLYEEFLIALHSVWRRRWLAILVAWGVALAGWLVLSLVPNTYESKASIFIQSQTLLPGKLGITESERRSGIDGITQTLTAAENLEKVVRGTELVTLAATPRDVANLAAGLRKTIQVTALQENLYEITAEAGMSSLSNAQNAKLSRDVVQRLLDLFVEGNLSGDKLESAQALRYLDAQLAAREKALQAAEARRVAFEQRYMGMLPGIGSPSQRMEAARAELGQVESNLMAAQGGLAALNAQVGGTPASIGSSGGGGSTAGIEAQIAEGRARGWTDSHPDMQALRRQLGNARTADRIGVGRASGGTPNPMYATLRSMQAEKQAAVAAFGARKAQLQAEMAQYQSRQVQEPGVAAEQARINRDHDVLKTQYDRLLADREEVRLRGSLASDTDQVRMRVIEPPSLPSVPATPNRPLLLALILIAAVGAGGGAAFAMSQIRTSYATAGRLERASGLPVIGAISEVTSPASRAEARRKLRLFTGTAAGLAGLFALLLVVEFVQRAMV